MFKIGDKVIPHQKSILGPLDSSVEWIRVKDTEHPFLYITEINSTSSILILHREKGAIGRGDYFSKEDVSLYPEWEVKFLNNTDKLNEYKFNPKIYEWVEIHCIDKSEHVLYKPTGDKMDYFFGHPYGLYILNNQSRDWAEENWNKRSGIIKKQKGMYFSDSLENLIAFNEDIKNQI